MAWIYLCIAGLFEIGWPLGLKLANKTGLNNTIAGVTIAIIAMALSGLFLYLAQRVIPIGTAYVVWTSIGAVGTFFVGILFFGDPSSLTRYFAIILIIIGVITLKVAQ